MTASFGRKQARVSNRAGDCKWQGGNCGRIACHKRAFRPYAGIANARRGARSTAPGAGCLMVVPAEIDGRRLAVQKSEGNIQVSTSSAKSSY